MSGSRTAPGWLRTLGRLCLRAYPASFRQECGGAYDDAVNHRWRRERARTGSFVAGLRTAVMLLGDTLRAAPLAHRNAWRPQRSNRARLPREGGASQGTADGTQPWASRGVGPWTAPRNALWAALSGSWMDARVAIRSLARRPGFSALVVLTLGLGIGANAAIFGALDRVVLRPLPYPDGDRMVSVMDFHLEIGRQTTPTGEAVERWREAARTVEWLETYRTTLTAEWQDTRGAEVLQVTSMSVGLPDALGVRPLVGRIPDDADLGPSNPPLVMLAESFWKRAFGADPGVVGRSLRLSDEISTIVGVWPAAAPLDPVSTPDLFRFHARDTSGDAYSVLALVRPGVTVGEVEAELRTLSEGGARSSQGFVPVVNAPYWMLGDAYVQALWLLFGGVLLLLVVTLANAANLMLNRTVTRAAEVGVRAAIGGSSGALGRLFLIEGLVLTSLGMGVALLVAQLGGTALAAWMPRRLPVLDGAFADRRVLAYTAILAAAAALLMALVPLVWARFSDVRALLARGAGGGRSGWLRHALLALQVAFAAVLVTGSALTLRSFRNVMAVNVGMDVERLAQFTVQLPSPRYPSPESRRDFWDRALEAVGTLPGVEGVTTSGSGLMRQGSIDMFPWRLEGGPPVPAGSVNYRETAGPEFFEVTGVPIVEGRGAATPDQPDAVIVNLAFARRHGGSVVGRRLTYDDSTYYSIIGVAGDVRAGELREDPDRLVVYRPEAGVDASSRRVILRVAGDPGEVLVAARTRIAEIDPTLPLRDPSTGPELLRAETARHRFLAQLLAIFGALSLLLAVTGVYGVVALDVSRRTREMGIRVALGAGARRVLREVIAGGLRPVLLGAGAGGVASLWAVRYLEGLLYRVSPTDPISVGAGVGVLLLAATAACWIPARRASRVEPIRVLRSE